MLTLTFLGVGSAFAKRNRHSSALIEAWEQGPEKQTAPDETLLIDFGGTGPTALYELKDVTGFSYLNRDNEIFYPAINSVLITHLHADHIGGLEELASRNMHCFIDAKTRRGFRPRIISTPQVLQSLWEQSLSGGLSALPGREATLADYFDLRPLQPVGNGGQDRFAMLNRYDLSLIPTDHIRIHVPFDWPSYAVLFTDRSSEETVLYSGDTRFNQETVDRHIQNAKLVFHDVQLIETEDAVHARMSELRSLPDSIRRRMFLYHYGDQWDDPEFVEMSREFAGFAEARHRYTLFD